MKRETLEAVSAQLVASIVHARTKQEAIFLLDELLTDTERVMLAKRFAAIAMLVRGYSVTQIAGLLKISTNTVTRIWRAVRGGHYPHLIRYAKNNPKKFEGPTFIDLLEVLMQGGVMPPMGRGKWDRIKRWERKSEYSD